MKKMMFTLMAFLTIAVNANAMSYEQAREEALFLTDKMAYELNLTDAQYEAAYEINLDYLMGVTSQYDVFGPYWERRNLDLSYILHAWQWDLFRAASYFYRPLFWEAGYWHFGIYARYPHRSYFYFGRPHFFNTYRGGHSWRMNNGRSFYEGRRDFYRPGNPGRDNHFGMRSGWDRGDYRGNNGGGRPSSTHITGGQHGGHNGGFRNGDGNGGFRNGGNGGFRNGGNGGFRNGGNGGFNPRNNGGGTHQGGTPQGGNGGFTPGNNGGGTHQGGTPQGGNGGFNPGNNGGGSMGGHSGGGSFGGSRSGSGSPSTRGGASIGGGRSGGPSMGGGRSGGPSMGGSRSTGGSHGGGSRGGFGGARR